MKKKLMIVDDSVFAYEEIKIMLEGTEFEIAGYAKSGEEAVEMVGTIMPDIITMDIILPGMDGMAAAEKILSQWPEIRIIVISSLAYDDTIEHAQKIGAKDFLFKPFDKEKLMKSLRNA